jgi:hypothetical protein
MRRERWDRNIFDLQAIRGKGSMVVEKAVEQVQSSSKVIPLSITIPTHLGKLNRNLHCPFRLVVIPSNPPAFFYIVSPSSAAFECADLNPKPKSFGKTRLQLG